MKDKTFNLIILIILGVLFFWNLSLKNEIQRFDSNLKILKEELKDNYYNEKELETLIEGVEDNVLNNIESNNGNKE